MSQSGPFCPAKPPTVAGSSSSELAKIAGMTPEVLSFKGRCELSPPTIRFPPTIRLGIGR